MNDELVYQIETEVSSEEFIRLLVASTLGERRPIQDTSRIKRMLQNANLIVTARMDGKLVGIARSITDHAYCTYLSDLAVDEKYQGMGIGKELIRQTMLAAPQAKVILISAPKAVGYYPKIGMSRHENCYFLDDVNQLK
jgi:predicted N-acetyltransferase YhbS